VGVPSSDRIIQDCDRAALLAMDVAYRQDGDIVPSPANRNGDRYSKRGAKPHGGAQVKSDKLAVAKFVYPMVRDVASQR